MNLAIWDIESSSAATDWASIIEIGGVLVDQNFKEIDRFQFRCRSVSYTHLTLPTNA